MPRRPYRLTDKLKYEFDNTLSKGVLGQVVWLALITLAVISVLAAVVLVVGISPKGQDLLDLIWTNLNRILDPGYVGTDTGGFWYVAVLFVITLFGVFVFSVLISILTSALEARLDQLRRGHTRVIERGHTVILGWSRMVAPIVEQLIEANRSEGRCCVVVYGDHDKVAMEEELARDAGPFRNTRVVCRRGDPASLEAPEVTSARDAKSVIIPGSDEDTSDIEVVKTLMALDVANCLKPGKTIATIRASASAEVTRVAGRNVTGMIETSDLVARLIVQTSRQTGLPAVYREVLDFAGSEFYFKSEPALFGRPFRDVLFAYRTSIPVGIRGAATGKAKEKIITLNPPMDRMYREGEEIVVLAEDNTKMPQDGLDAPAFEAGAIVQPVPLVSRPENTLIIGWNRRLERIVRQLDRYVAKGSSLAITAVMPVPEDMAKRIRGAVSNYKRPAITAADTTRRDVLESIDPAEYDQIIILANAHHMTEQEADAHTLVKLVHLRDIVDQADLPHGRRPPSFVTEMLDIRNRALAQGGRSDDFIVSDEIVSMMLAQISENPDLLRVFGELMDPDGSEIYLRPAADYIRPNARPDFYTVTEAAARRGEVALGYRLYGQAQKPPNHGVWLNPDKARRLPELCDDDRIVVLARRQADSVKGK